MTGRKTRILMALIALTLLGAGCTDNGTSGEASVLDVEPRYDVNALNGYSGEGDEALYVFRSGEAEGWLKRVVTAGVSPPDTIDDDPVLVVFRGVFPTGGYAVKVENVTRRGNRLTVHATYTDPSEDAMVTQAFTHPTAFVPVELEPGRYEAELVVTRVERGPGGETVLERDQVHDTREFTVR